MNPDCLITVSSPAEVVAVAPYVLGFHPTDSFVVLGLRGHTVDFAVRYDLPPPDAIVDFAEVAEVVVQQGGDRVILLGYGPPGPVTSALLGVGRALVTCDVPIIDVLRVAEGRWWSFGGGPADGTPCSPGLAAEAVYRGMVALPDRKALEARVASVEGAARRQMDAATERARARIADLAADDLRAGRGGQWVRKAGREAIRWAERQVRSARQLSDDEVAWLGALLVKPVVLDYALDRSGADEWRVRLWGEVVRRVDPEFVPGPACLLSYAAWQAGDGALARVAVDRALKEDPAHRMSGSLDRLLAAGLRPELLVKINPAGRGGGPSRGAGAGRAARTGDMGRGGLACDGRTESARTDGGRTDGGRTDGGRTGGGESKGGGGGKGGGGRAGGGSQRGGTRAGGGGQGGGARTGGGRRGKAGAAASRNSRSGGVRHGIGGGEGRGSRGGSPGPRTGTAGTGGMNRAGHASDVESRGGGGGAGIGGSAGGENSAAGAGGAGSPG